MFVRPATPADHPAFVRLFPELAVSDPILDAARFARDLVPSTYVAATETGVIGYAYFQIVRDTVYVRHLVTAPDARRRGVGRALLGAVVELARSRGAVRWCLNVKPTNTAAIALYESLGMRQQSTSRALAIAWHDVAAMNVTPRLTARAIDPGDDRSVEGALRLLEGQLEDARALGGRVLIMLEEDATVVGAAVFDPAFPGAFPFRVARPALAGDLLRALQPFARPADASVRLVVENQADVAEALVAAGATVTLDIVHLSGALPSA